MSTPACATDRRIPISPQGRSASATVASPSSEDVASFSLHLLHGGTISPYTSFAFARATGVNSALGPRRLAAHPILRAPSLFSTRGRPRRSDCIPSTICVTLTSTADSPSGDGPCPRSFVPPARSVQEPLDSLLEAEHSSPRPRSDLQLVSQAMDRSAVSARLCPNVGGEYGT